MPSVEWRVFALGLIPFAAAYHPLKRALADQQWLVVAIAMVYLVLLRLFATWMQRRRGSDGGGE